MGTPAVSFSDIPQGATVVQGYSDLPKGATVVHGEPSAASRFWSAFAPQAQNILTHPLGVSQAVGQPVDINNPPKLQWSMPGSVGEAAQRIAGPTWQEIKDFVNQATGASEFAKGNIAGGAGHLAASALPLAFGMVAGEGEKPAPTPAAPSATRNAVAGALRTASDIVDPDITGLISPRAAHLQRTLGRIADRMQAQPETAPATQTAPPESMTATAPMPAGRVQPTVSMRINPDVQQWQGTTAEVAGPKPTAALQKAGPVAAAPTQDAVDLAKALGAGTPARAEARFGKEAWERMVRGKDAVADAVDAAVPAGKVNDAATNMAGAALATGNIQHAQDVIQAAATAKPIGPEQLPPTDFKLQARNPNGTLIQQPSTRALQWEDFLDDKAWKNRIEADYGTEQESPLTFEQWTKSKGIPQSSFATLDEVNAHTWSGERFAQVSPEMTAKLNTRDALVDQYHKEVPASEAQYESPLYRAIRDATAQKFPISREGQAIQTEETKAAIERSRMDVAKSTLADIAREELGMPKPEAKFAVGDTVKFAGGSGTVTRISPDFGVIQVDTGGHLPRLFGAGELKLSSGRGAQRRAAP